jgi:tetratricopeptide (TPR) repeat protein
MRLAESTMREAAALPPVTEYLEYNQKALAVFLLGRGRWDDALREAESLAAGKWAATRTLGQALRGHALLALGRTAEAREALSKADRELATVPALVGGLSISRTSAQPWVEALRGELLLRSGDAEKGRAILKDVERALRATPGPDAWIQALFRLESIARLARDVRDWDLAEYTALQMLDHDRAYAGSQLAFAYVAEHKGDRASAMRARTEAVRYWRDADQDLPELALLRSKEVAERLERPPVRR